VVFSDPEVIPPLIPTPQWGVLSTRGFTTKVFGVTTLGISADKTGGKENFCGGLRGLLAKVSDSIRRTGGKSSCRIFQKLLTRNGPRVESSEVITVSSNLAQVIGLHAPPTLGGKRKKAVSKQFHFLVRGVHSLARAERTASLFTSAGADCSRGWKQRIDTLSRKSSPSSDRLRFWQGSIAERLKKAASL